MQTQTANNFEVVLTERPESYAVQLADNLKIEVRHVGVITKGALFSTVRDEGGPSSNPPRQTVGDGLVTYARFGILTGRGNDKVEHFGTVEFLNESDVRTLIKQAGLVGDTVKIINVGREIYKIWLARHFSDGSETLRKAFADATGIVNKSELVRHVYAIGRQLKQLQVQVEAVKLNFNEESELVKFSKKWEWLPEAVTYLDDLPIEKDNIEQIKDAVRRWQKLVKI